MPKNKIKISVTTGWVTLDGDVDWHYQKRAAEESVHFLFGVRGVSNNVKVIAAHGSVIKSTKPCDPPIARIPE